jgi:dCTP deaminase
MSEAQDNSAKAKPPTRNGFWSGETIAHRLGTDKLVDPPSYDSIDKSSYQLTVGDEVFVSPASATDPKYRTKRQLKPGQTFEIPPGQFALLLTAEIVSVPQDAIAFISTRSKETKFRGLINVSGFHVDPGYHGKLIFAMFNAGPSSIHVTRGDALFAIFFADLDREDSEMVRDSHEGFASIQSGQIMPLANEFLTFQGLDAKVRETREALEARLQKVERDNAIIMWASALLISFLIAFGVKSYVTTTDTGQASRNVAAGQPPIQPSGG